MHYKEYVRFTEIGALFIFVGFLINPVLSPYFSSLGLDEFQIGLVFSMFSLSIIIFSPMMGRLSDVSGRKLIIFSGIVIEMVGMLLYLYGGSLLTLMVARILNGVGYSAVTLSVLAKIEDSLDRKSHGKYVGWALSIEHVSRMVAPVVGGLIADMFFIRAPFMVAFVFLVMLLVYVFIKERPRREGTPSLGDFNPLKEIREFLAYKDLRGMAVLGMVMHASTPSTIIFLPLFLIDRFDASFTLVGIAFFAMGLFHLLQFYFGKLCDRKGSKTILLPGTFLSGLFLILFAFSPTYPILLLMALLMGVGNSMWNISAWCTMSNVGESIKKEGQVVMTYTSIAKIGAFFSTILGGLVAKLYGIDTLFILNGTLIIAGTLIVLIYWTPLTRVSRLSCAPAPRDVAHLSQQSYKTPSGYHFVAQGSNMQILQTNKEINTPGTQPLQELTTSEKAGAKYAYSRDYQ